jgi:DNA polymerase III subunit epsilon
MVLDTETTGLAGHDRIVEIAIAQIDGLLEKGRTEPRIIFHTFVDPEIPGPWSATGIHGITERDVRGAPTWTQVWDRIGGWLTDPAETLCAHNAAFDRRFVSTLRCKAAGDIEVPSAGLWLDTMKIVKRVCGADPKPGAAVLTTACEQRGIRIGGHRAHTDALATAELLVKLIPEAYALPAEQRPPERPLLGEWLGWQNAGRPKRAKATSSGPSLFPAGGRP